MLVIAVIAVIFVGPKDLPSMLRTFGRFSRKVRGIAGDFQRQVDDALREAELDSVRDSLNDVRSLNPRKMVTDSLKPVEDDLSKGLDDVATTLDKEKSATADGSAGAEGDAAPDRRSVKVEKAVPAGSGTNAVPGFAASPPVTGAEAMPPQGVVHETARPATTGSGDRKPAEPKVEA